MEGAPVWEFPDTEADENKDKLEESLRMDRVSRYAHLNDRRFEKVVELVRRRSRTFYVEGAPSTAIKGVEFDIELKEGARPQKARQPKISPAETEKQKVHIEQKVALGHMSFPVVVGEWSTSSKIVFKKADEAGRWIFDFRPLNRATKPSLTRTVDLVATIQEMAGCLWKTTLDAWAGFNQVKASPRARELMQVLTVSGVMQWEVMPFGVTNGPEPDGSTVPGAAGIGAGSDGSVSGSGSLHGRRGAGIWTV